MTSDIIYDAANGVFISLEQRADGVAFIQVIDVLGNTLTLQRTKVLENIQKVPIGLTHTLSDNFIFLYQRINNLWVQSITNTGETIIQHQVYKKPSSSTSINNSNKIIIRTYKPNEYDNDANELDEKAKSSNDIAANLAGKHLIISWSRDINIDVFDNDYGIQPDQFVGFVTNKQTPSGKMCEVALKGSIFETENIPSKYVGRQITINTMLPNMRFPDNIAMYKNRDQVLIGTCISVKEIIVGL
jgi:hypothetical protein